MEDLQKFDQQIGIIEKQMDDIRNEMEKISKKFIKETKEFVSNWSRKEVESAIFSKPDRAKELGKEKLRKLKTDLQYLLKEIPELVNKNIDNQELWAHRANVPEEVNQDIKFSSEAKWRRPENVEDAVKGLFRYTGKILYKYGILNIGNYGPWQLFVGDEMPRYQYGYNMPEEMRAEFENYKRMYDKLMEQDIELKIIKKNKKIAEVKNLWEKI